MSAEERAAKGNTTKRRQPATVLAHPSAPAVPERPTLPVVDEADAPDDLTMEERKVWMRLAPKAMAAGTLTVLSAESFAKLCRLEVVVNELANAPLQKGTPNHRAWIHELDGMYANFGLRPAGKPMPDAAASQPEKPSNPLDKFLKRSRGASA
jgi:hypothetical protein